jgi:8-oxo-dGTP diphosphatase
MAEITAVKPAAKVYPNVQVAAVLLRRGDDIVLVQERRGDLLFWSVPGGGVELGELVTEALVRETREETGVVLHSTGRLAYIVNSSSERFPSSVALFFECYDWDGEIAPADPDNEILDAALFGRDEAIRLLESSALTRPEIEPLLAYLRAPAGPPAIWSYRDELSVAPLPPNRPSSFSNPSGRTRR